MANAKKLLVIEDEEPLLLAIVDKFRRQGFITLTARDGESGLATAAAEKPDLILLDIIMPKMDGLTMLKRLRQDSWGKNVPVVILTNLSDSEQVAEALEHGVFDYLVKTHWTLNGLVSKVKEKLSLA